MSCRNLLSKMKNMCCMSLGNLSLRRSVKSHVGRRREAKMVINVVEVIVANGAKVKQLKPDEDDC